LLFRYVEEAPMTRGQARVWIAASMVALVVVVPAAARAADVITASPQREPIRHVETGASYVAAGAFGGWGLSLRGGYLANQYVMTGLGVETARLHAEGIASPFDRPFSQTYQSTLAAAFIRAQLPTRFVTPYAELALGLSVIHGTEGFNYQCKERTFAGGGAALGVDGHVLPSLSVGVRAGVRPPGPGACAAAAGPWTYEPAAMKSMALMLAYRW
jgi:hypothetical protein